MEDTARFKKFHFAPNGAPVKYNPITVPVGAATAFYSGGTVPPTPPVDVPGRNWLADEPPRREVGRQGGWQCSEVQAPHQSAAFNN